MIGLSISFCIKDIVAGQIALADVDKIVSGTSCNNPDAWERLIKMYRESYWHNNPDECERILRQLLAEGKIYQPRVNGGRPPLLASDNGLTKWINSESEIRYCESW